MSRRNTKEDVPRRIYRSTIERINSHIKASPKIPKTGTRKFVKTDFNRFIETLLDTYENLQSAERLYASEVFEDKAEALGAAIVNSKGNKNKIKQVHTILVLAD